MESEKLDGTDWDVVIVGTDVPQSLLALALSRSGKKILHVDENAYYGGSHAAFTLQEAEEWVQRLSGRAGNGSENKSEEHGPAANGGFRNAQIRVQERTDDGNETVPMSNSDTSKLSYSRAYTLSLSPEIIYARSQLLQVLVSSKAFKQLELLTVGSWWIYSTPYDLNDAMSTNSEKVRFRKVPNGREDIFADRDFGLQEKRSMMKFLRFVSKLEEQEEVREKYAEAPFATFLTEHFGLPSSLHEPLYALTMLSDMPEKITTEVAMSRIQRHLTSMGVFGPGFSAVVPRWGGMSEIAQVSCRAGAVGGGIYVLGTGVESIREYTPKPETKDTPTEECRSFYHSIKLDNGEIISAKWIMGSGLTLQGKLDYGAHPYSEPSSEIKEKHSKEDVLMSRLISIVSAPLSTFFSHRVEGAPAPAVVVVYFPAGSLNEGKEACEMNHPPIQVLVHSSDTGECPNGQCILYASILMSLASASQLLDKAIQKILNFASSTTSTITSAAENDKQEQLKDSIADATTSVPQVLWSMRFEQFHSPYGTVSENESHMKAGTTNPASMEGKHTRESCDISKTFASRIAALPGPMEQLETGSRSSDYLCFDDGCVESVRKVWSEILKDLGGEDKLTGEKMNDERGEEDERVRGSAEGALVSKEEKQRREGEEVEFMTFDEREVDGDDDA